MYSLVPTSAEDNEVKMADSESDNGRTQRHLSVNCDCVRSHFGWLNGCSQTRRSKAKIANFR